MDVLTVRTQVQSALSSHLGTYTLGNGATTPAISVRSANEPLPGGTKVTGLEAIIIREPQLEEARVYKDALATRRWTVYLVDWSGAGKLEAAAAALAYAIPGARSFDVFVPEGAGPRSQKRVLIPTNAPAT